MSADKRNTSVVIALVVSMTLGLLMLLWLEEHLVPTKRDWSGGTLLMAERGLRVEDVRIVYAPTWSDVTALGVDPQGDDSVCLIDPAGRPQWEPRGPRVQVVVIGADEAPTAERLADAQKQTLQGVLGTLSEASGRGLVPVRLAEAPVPDSGLAARQAADLREFLELKGFIPSAPR